MISLAGRDILHAWGKFVFTGIGLGLLIGVTLVMAGVYRGMVDDGKALLDNSGADLWVVQKDTLGPYAESSSLNDDVYRAARQAPAADGLHDASLALLPYEAGRPSAEAACRVGDARVLAQGEG
jgi:putative ABC transport system permease protein